MSQDNTNNGSGRLSKAVESQSERAEKKADNKTRDQASEGMDDHSKKVVAQVQERRALRKSGVTGKFAEDGKPGLASADSLLPLETAKRAAESLYKAGSNAVSETGKFLKGMGDGEVEYVKELGDSLNVAVEYYGRALTGKINLAADMKVFSGAIGQTLGTAGDYYFKQLPKGPANLGRDISEAGKAAGDHWNSLDTEQKGKFFGKEVVPVLVPGAVGMVAKEAQAANLTGKAGQAITSFAGYEKMADIDQKFAAIQSKLQQMHELAQPLKPAYQTASDVRVRRPNLQESAAKNDNVMAMSNKTDGLGSETSKFKGRGMDSTGKALSFSEESGIELGTAKQGQDKVWQQAPFPRGDDIHVGLGENLPPGTKTIDRLVFKDGIVESQKSIDLKSPSYESPQKLESKLTDYVHKLEMYKGQPKKRSGPRFGEDEIENKILHIGINDRVMTAEQKAVFEKVGKSVQQYNENLPAGKAPIKLKVTVVK